MSPQNKKVDEFFLLRKKQNSDTLPKLKFQQTSPLWSSALHTAVTFFVEEKLNFV